MRDQAGLTAENGHRQPNHRSFSESGAKSTVARQPQAATASGCNNRPVNHCNLIIGHTIAEGRKEAGRNPESPAYT